MNIIISNDDGITSNGIIKLAERLAKDNEVLIVAPDGNRSAFSHSLTLSDTITVKEENCIEGCKAFAISGTPADCVKFAKLKFNDFNADIVVSGINKGHNIGSDILYSGTVSVACEAAFFGHVAFAFSAFSHDDENDFELYSEYAVKLINLLLPISTAGDIWNINFPDTEKEDIKGVKFTQLGKQVYSDKYVKISENEYLLTGKRLKHYDNDEDCDVEWIQKGYITVTPILFNKTNYQKIKEIKEKCVEL